jgi:hypothetical protein
MASGPTSSPGYSSIYPMSTNDYYDARGSCKLRRQQPVKRESSRRILVRPLIQRRREPSISSSCESLDETRLPIQPFNNEQSQASMPFTPSASTISEIIEPLHDENPRLARSSSLNESLSDDGDINLYEMRVPIGKTYDTSDISVQLEGPKILIHCHTIEPTDRRGNYRKHEFKTELLVPDVVDDETILAYLTEDGQLIVEGKYHAWAWNEIRQKRQLDQAEQSTTTATPVLSPPIPTATLKNDTGMHRQRIVRCSLSLSQQDYTDRVKSSADGQRTCASRSVIVFFCCSPSESMQNSSGLV